MANTSSAKKQARESLKRAERNKSAKSAVKTYVVRVRRALGEGNVDGVDALALAAVKSLDRAASKGILHPNNAARRKSRLMKRLNASQATGPAAAAPTKSGGRQTRKTASSASTTTTKPASRRSKTS